MSLPIVAWRFLKELFGTIALSKSVVLSFVKPIAFVTALALTFWGWELKVNEKIRVVTSVDKMEFFSTEVSMTQIVAGCMLLVWLLLAVGYSLARTKWRILEIDDQIILDPIHRYFRVQIRSQSFVPVKPRIDVEKVVDDNGANHPVCIHLPMEVHWSNENVRQELTTDTPHTVGPLKVEDQGFLSIGALTGKYQQIDQHVPRNERKKLWFELTAKDPFRIIARKWFAVWPDTQSSVGYSAAREDPPEAK